MSKSFQMVLLGEVISHRQEFVQINDLKTYKRCRVQLHAKGIVLRDIVSGAEIKTKKQQVCRAGEFLVAEIDAKVGGFGIVPGELDGAIVSSHYFLFQLNENVLDKRFLDYFIRTPTFREQVNAQGTTNYAAIRPKDVLEYKIPLPPLSEQCRIVARIEELTAKIEEARMLRQQAMEEVEALIVAEYGKIFAKLKLSNQLPLNKIAIEVGQQVQAGQMEYFDYPYLSLENIESQTGRILRFRTCQEAEIRGTAVLFGTDDVLYSKLRPYLNKVTTPSFEGCATTELVVFKPETKIVNRNYLATFLRNPQIVKDAVANSVGTKMPRTNMRWFRQLLVPVPPLNEQRRIVAYQDKLQAKVDALKHLQAETEAEIDALMPSILDKAFKGKLRMDL